MMKEFMFDVIPLRSYNHLVGNCGSKVWAKCTAQTAVQWTPMIPLNGPGMPGCYCPITIWSDKEMFVARTQ